MTNAWERPSNIFFSTTVIGNIPHTDTFSWLRDWQLSAVSHHSLMIGRHGKERKEQFHFPWNVLACCTAPFVLLPSAELECSKSACVTLEMSNCYLWLRVRWWVCREHVQISTKTKQHKKNNIVVQGLVYMLNYNYHPKMQNSRILSLSPTPTGPISGVKCNIDCLLYYIDQGVITCNNWMLN